MLRSFSIKNFRCFKDLTIGPLERVNLIAGANNVGKTALLEAIFMFIGAPDISPALRVGVSRGFEGFKREDPAYVRELIWKSLFRDFDTKATIQLSGTLSDGGQHEVKLGISGQTSSRVAIVDGQPQLLEIGYEDLFGQALQLVYTDPSGETQTTVMLIDQNGPRVSSVIGKKDAQGGRLRCHRCFQVFSWGPAIVQP